VRLSKLLVIVLLMFSAFSPLLMAQLVPGQTAVTETSTGFATSTISGLSQALVTATVTQPIHYDAAPPSYNIQSDSFFLDQVKMKIHGHLHNVHMVNPLLEIDVYPCLHYEYFLFSAVASQQVFVHFEAPNIVSFYIMNPRQLDYVDNYACNNGSWPSPVRTVALSSDLNWTVPQSGQYAFVFAGRDIYPIRFTAYTLSTAIESTTQTYATTTTYQIQNVVTTMLAPTMLTQTASSTQFPFEYLVLIGVAIAFVLSLVVIRMKRMSPGIKPR
jgi:hypothetical protein